MSVDPNAPQGLPPGMPPGAGGPAGAAPSPTTDPAQLAQIISAIMAQGAQQFEGQQQAALATAVTTLLQQSPNAAGEAASTLPGAPTPPAMPSGAGGAPPDPSLQGGPGPGY